MKVVGRSGSAGVGSVVSWRFGLILDRDDAQVFVVDAVVYWVLGSDWGIG